MTNPIDRLLRGIPQNPGHVAQKQRMGWLMDPEEVTLLRRAAEKRNISRTAFCKWAIIAFACQTLGLDFYEYIEDRKMGRIQSYEKYEGTHGGKPIYGKQEIVGSEKGRGAGPWRIRSLD